MEFSNQTDGWVSRYGQWVVRYRYLCVLLSLVLFFATASGMKNLAFTSSYKVFFSQENQFLTAYESMQKVYSNGDSALIVVAPKDGEVFANNFLTAIEELTLEAWQVPGVYRVDSITNFQHTWASEEGLEVRNLVPDAETISRSELAEAKTIALGEPLLVNRLISKDGSVTAVNVSVRLPDGDDKIVAEVAAHVRLLRDKYEQKYPDLDIYLTGVAMMSNAFPEVSIQEMSTTTPTMFLIILAFCFIVLRSFFGTLVTLVVIIFSIVAALGFAGHVGIKMTQVSANVPIIVLTLAVADSIHILSTFFQQLRLGKPRADAVVESIRTNFSPVVITTLTTVVGFLGLNLSDAPPFHDLGNMTAVGLTAALIYSLLLLPAIIAILPLSSKKKAAPLQQFMDYFSDWILYHRTRVLYGSFAVGALLLAMTPGLTVDENFVDNFAKGLEIRDDSDFTQEHLTGLFNMEFSLESGEEGGVTSPEFLNKVDQFVQWSRKQPGILHVNSITDTLKRINQSMNAGDDAYYMLPADRDLLAQYLLAYEMSLPLGLDVNDQINVGRSSTKVTVTLDDLSTFEMQAAKERHEQWLRNNAPATMHAEAASASLMYAYLMNSNIKGLLLGTAISFFCITLCLGIIFRSVKYALVCMLPNALPIAFAFGLWSLIDGVVGIAAATIATMTLGIVVDDTVHFVSRYLQAKRELNIGPERAVRHAFSAVGVALISTSLIFIVGFGSMMHSDFLMNAQMGIFTVMTVFFALLLDFLLLPALLLRLDCKAEPEAPTDAKFEPLLKRI